jgi:hypothetical protein
MINCPTCEFADFGKDKCKRLLTRLPHICPYAVERKPRNRFEKMKAMTMEEMAEFIEEEVMFHPHCKPEKDCTNDDSCIPCWLDWLKEEVK